MLSLLQITDPSEEDAAKCVNEIIKQVSTFLEGFQIVPDYTAFDPIIQYYKKAMLLVYDATNAVRTIIHYTEMYEMLTNIQLDHNACDEHECCHCDDCSCEVKEEPKIYKVTSMLNSDDELEIKSVEESFCTPDEIDIIDQDGDMVSVHVCGYNEEEAVNDAIEIFKANEYKVGGIE